MAFALLALALGLAGANNWALRGLRPSFLAPQFASSRRAFDAIVGQWSDAQLAAYRRWLRIDFATLACYAGFGWLWAAGSTWLALALPAAALADAAENLLHLRLTRPGATSAAEVLYLASGIASTLKFGLIAAFAVGAILMR